MSKTSENKTELTVISLNAMGLFNFDTIRGFMLSGDHLERGKKIAEILADENADVVSLQEVHTYAFLNVLKNRLPKLNYIAYKKSLIGPRGGLVIFSKLPLENADYSNFSDRGSFLNTSIASILRKSGILTVKIKNKNIYILSAHLTQNMDFDWTSKNRFYKYIKSQLNQVTNTVRKLSSDSNSVIVTGDFNTDKKSALYKNFINSINLIDVFEKYESPTMHQIFLPRQKKARRLDYIFLYAQNSKPTIRNRTHIFTGKHIIKKSKLTFLSDHIGLKASFSL